MENRVHVGPGTTPEMVLPSLAGSSNAIYGTEAVGPDNEVLLD